MYRYVKANINNDGLPFTLPRTFTITCGDETWECKTNGHVLLCKDKYGHSIGTSNVAESYCIDYTIDIRTDITPDDLTKRITYGLEQYLNEVVPSEYSYSIDKVYEMSNRVQRVDSKLYSTYQAFVKIYW